MSQRFDWVVVQRLLDGVPTPIHPDEQAETIRQCIAQGMTRRQMRDVLGWSWGRVAGAFA